MIAFTGRRSRQCHSVDSDHEVPEVMGANLSMPILLVARVYSLSLTGSLAVSVSSRSPVCDVRVISLQSYPIKSAGMVD
jgi:hypothetical protein